MKELMERREFLKLMGGAMSGLMAWSCNARHTPPLSASRLWLDYHENRRLSVCGQCSGGCGIVARVIDGRVVKIDGNILHPVNRGAVCAAGQAGTQLLYHPNRFKHPMKRIGGKGSDRWKKIEWTEATDVVTSRLMALRGRGEAHSFVMLDGKPDGIGQAFFTTFCDALGTPNYFPVHPPDLTHIAGERMHGAAGGFSYDLQNSNYILSFGCDLLEGWRSPAYASRTLGYLRQERPGAKAKLVQIDRLFSTTASKADEWVPIRPLTEGALALAIANVMVREGLADNGFIASNARGFEEFASVLENYRPEDVAPITGIAADRIVRLAREFAAHRPSVAISDIHATSCPNGATTAMAIHSLNALAGSIDAAGCVSIIRKLPFTTMPLPNPGSAPRIGANVEAIPDAILSREPYPVEMLVLRNFDPISSTRLPARFRQALDAVPLVVTFASFPDRTTEAADLILPDPAYLEKWLGVSVAPAFGSPVFSVAAPVIEPLHETMQTEDFILRLARDIGGPVAQAFPWPRFSEFLRHLSSELHQAKGHTFGESSEFPDFDRFWETLIKRGGWQAAANPAPPLKFDFCPGVLAEAAFAENTADQDGLFVHVTGLDRADCSSMRLPWLQEIRGLSAEWKSWAEINPLTASDLEIADGEWIRIETPRGELKTRARIYAGAMPGVIYIPAGDSGVNEILELHYDKLSGEPAWFSTRAKLHKV